MKKGKPRLYNAPNLQNRRCELRNHSTGVEAILWKSLQNRKVAGKKFRRQMSIGPYIVDFFCPECKLAIELDGAPHYRELTIEYDAKRTAYLESQGVTVMRFENRIIYEDLENALALIRQRLLAVLDLPPRLRH
jgi:very-short-patch-repair endonuclease